MADTIASFANQTAPPPSAAHKQVVATLGALFIPSKPGDPGYQDLESHGISDEVMKNFPINGIETFNEGARPFFDGKTFLELDDQRRGDYLRLVAEGSSLADAADGRNLVPLDAGAPSRIADEAQRMKLHAFYRAARRRILGVYYSNYPEHRVPRDANGLAILKPGDTHQDVNPNTKKLITGWDITGRGGPMTWEEEEKAREFARKTLSYWQEGDLIKLDPKRPPAAAAIKTGEGHDYYDVIVLGGGTAGCIVASRLAERGINPKTGDRLRVAMIEGGQDWTVRDPGIRPGYGYPIRRRMITLVRDGSGPENSPAYRWPQDTSSNFKIVGGCSVHYGGTTWIPVEEDFTFYKQASGVAWDLAKFGGAIQEVRDLFGVAQPPATWWSKGDYVWSDAARALGLEIRTPEVGHRNMLEFNAPGGLNRIDSKGTALPWAYVGLNNGLKIIPEAEVDRVLIEKSSGRRPVAIGAVYKDKSGQMHEVRAARVVVAMGTVHTPLMLYRSGFGPRELLGDKTIVENNNVGNHLTGDVNLVAAAHLAEPVDGVGERRSADPWVAVQPRPWPELSVQIRASGAEGPQDIFAPAFGWEHKEFMRNGFGARHLVNWRCHVGAIPAEWRVLPNGRIERVKMDVERCNATRRETYDLVKAWQGKLAVKPVKVAFANNFVNDASRWPPLHKASTTRAGVDPKTSVCSPDFDCHDIDNLLFTSASTIPKTFFWTCGPVSVHAAYAWRRMIANHFSTGSSTRGYL